MTFLVKQPVWRPRILRLTIVTVKRSSSRPCFSKHWIGTHDFWWIRMNLWANCGIFFHESRARVRRFYEKILRILQKSDYRSISQAVLWNFFPYDNNEYLASIFYLWKISSKKRLCRNNFHKTVWLVPQMLNRFLGKMTMKPTDSYVHKSE